MTLCWTDPVSVVRLGKVQCRTDGNNSRGIDVVVSDVVMPLNVIEVHRLRDAGLLIKIHQIALQVLIVDDSPNVALKVPMIDAIEADERTKKPPIRFDDPRPE